LKRAPVVSDDPAVYAGQPIPNSCAIPERRTLCLKLLSTPLPLISLCLIFGVKP
jgi:hypothetical protein